jgi:hypothetical protein
VNRGITILRNQFGLHERFVDMLVVTTRFTVSSPSNLLPGAPLDEAARRKCGPR